jgi:hypothetical protein
MAGRRLSIHRTFWEEPFAALAEEFDLPVRTLDEAVQEARAFIRAIHETDGTQ